MLAMSKIDLESRDYDFWMNHAKTNFQCSQAYLIPFGFEIAVIFSPL